jgi:magnesium transporter
MKTYYKNAAGIVVTPEWAPNSWIHIECPTEEDKKFITDELGIPLSFINDIEDMDERPRIEIEEDWYFIIIRVPYRNGNPKLPYSTAPLGLIFKDDVFVSLSFVKTDMVPDFVQYSVRKNKNFADYYELVLKLILSSAVWFLKYLKQINFQIKSAESELERSIKNEDLQTLLEIEKCLVYFTTSLKGNAILINRIRNLKNLKEEIDPELMEDVEIEIKQAQEMTNVYSDILSGMMDAYASVISNNLNIIMKQLTSISIILMIPTLVASLYGMNVPNVFQNSSIGFWLIMVISFLISLTVVILFKRKKWF